MTLSEFMGIKNADIDIETGKRMDHRSIYRRCIQRLGGLNVVKPYIPFSLNQIKDALQEDECLNSLSMEKWDRASGFCCRNADCIFIGTGIVHLYKKYGITSFSNAQGVCILKEAARELVELEYEAVN